MKRPVRYPSRQGYTLAEILIAVALSLMLLSAVVVLLANVGRSVNDARATLEMNEGRRAVKERLLNDLQSITVTTWPPQYPEKGNGYFEITEGAMGPLYAPYTLARNTDMSPATADTTVGDIDDMLMCTIRSKGAPYVGRCVRKIPVPAGGNVHGMDDRDGDGTRGNSATDEYQLEPINAVESYEAEVMYYVRGRTLYRRLLLVSPDFPHTDLDLRTPAISESMAQLDPYGFYNNDVSVRMEYMPNKRLVANTLSDLTKPENRYAHRPLHYYGPSVGYRHGFPYHPHFTWNFTGSLPPWDNNIPHGTTVWDQLHLPTLRESSYINEGNPNPGNPYYDWEAGAPLRRFALNPHPINPLFDAWRNPHPWAEVEPITGTLTAQPIPPPPGPAPNPPCFMGSRIAEDVILTNVLSFDVKVWDPQAPVLRAVDDAGTNADFNTDSGDDDVIPNARVVPGDPGYNLALAHCIEQWLGGAEPKYLPVSLGAYVDLHYSYAMTQAPYSLHTRPGYNENFSQFSGPGDPRSGLARVYDTWSNYERDQPQWLDWNGNGTVDLPGEVYGDQNYNAVDIGDRNGNGVFDFPHEFTNINEGSDGFDNNGDGVVDDACEMETAPPYPYPLTGIQIKIRVFEPVSQQIRDETIIHDFSSR